jgi:hypothetical protein
MSEMVKHTSLLLIQFEWDRQALMYVSKAEGVQNKVQKNYYSEQQNSTVHKP